MVATWFVPFRTDLAATASAHRHRRRVCDPLVSLVFIRHPAVLLVVVLMLMMVSISAWSSMRHRGCSHSRDVGANNDAVHEGIHA
jgi:hypothetical protein